MRACARDGYVSVESMRVAVFMNHLNCYEMRNICKISIGISEEKKQFQKKKEAWLDG
jgi:hypothetical protein